MDEIFQRRLDEPRIIFLCQQWVRAFDRQRDRALENFVKLMLKCLGSEASVQAEDVTAEGIFDLVSRVEDELDQRLTYPLIGNDSRMFESNFSQMMGIFADLNLPSNFLSNDFQDVCVGFLLLLSSCKSSTARHTATLALVKMSTLLLEYVARPDSQEKEQVQTLIRELFSKVLRKRYIDTYWRVRLIVVKELRHWMAEFSDQLSVGVLLPQIAENLYDVTAAVRLECVTALIDVFQRVSGSGQEAALHDFVEGEKGLLIDSVFDTVAKNVCAGLRLLQILFPMFPDIFNEQDGRRAAGLLCSPDKKVAQQAKEFFDVIYPNGYAIEDFV